MNRDMKKKIVLFLSLCIFTCFTFFNMCANASVPVEVFPWEVTFEDYGRIFYMTPPQLPHQSQLDFFNMPEVSEERMRIKTGLYYNESLLTNIYHVDIVAHRCSVIFSICGSYFATLQHTIDNFDREILGGGLVNFFSNGNLIKSYTVEDLLANPDEVTYTSAGKFWKSGGTRRFNQQANFNPETNALTVETFERQTFIFDISTGEIISQTGAINESTLVRLVRWLLSALLVICIAFIFYSNTIKRFKGINAQILL